MSTSEHSARPAFAATAGSLWKHRFEYNHRHGPGGSPVLFQDVLIYNCDGTDVQFVAALDKHTGELRWKKTREGRMAYSTPLAIEVQGKPQLVSTGGDRVVTYHPLSGEEIWSVRYDGFSLVPSPCFRPGSGLYHLGVPASRALRHPPRRSRRRDRKSRGLDLEARSAAESFPLLVGEELYMVSDRGIASCVDARTGKHHWQERLPGEYSASPVYAEGKIYLLNGNRRGHCPGGREGVQEAGHQTGCRVAPLPRSPCTAAPFT